MPSQPDSMPGGGEVVPKLCGSDVELGNFIIERKRQYSHDTGGDAAKALLAQVNGYARQAARGWNQGTTSYSSFGDLYSSSVEYQYEDASISSLSSGAVNDGAGTNKGYRPYAQDIGRKFLAANGGCAYIDLNHLEICVPECRSAFDHLAASRAMLMIAREAMNRANERMPAGATIKVLANNSDGRGHSYGSHLNFLITRKCFNNILHRKPHYLHFLATFQAAAIVLTGAGKVGSENETDPAKYQISARADFIETMVSEATTYRRPMINARDEALAGSLPGHNKQPARLHVIMFDHVLCHHAALLRVGMMQVILCMIERRQVPTDLLLEEPISALHQWSRDPNLNTKASLVNGDQCTAVESLCAIYERASRFVDSGGADGLVPQVERIMMIWGECLEKLRRRDMDYLAARIDWVAKLYLLERAASKRGGWDPLRVKYLDNLWSSLDPGEGLYWMLEKAGAVQTLVSPADVERFAHEPPEDTRAWLRAWALRHAAASH
jgi:hypothetical protein